MPLHEQVAASARKAIATGELKQGERLPAARELAESLEINLHTVLRAYQTLRDEGLVELRRGRGATVIASHPGHARVHELLGELITEGTRLGLGRTELARLIEEHP